MAMSPLILKKLKTTLHTAVQNILLLIHLLSNKDCFQQCSTNRNGPKTELGHR